MRKKILYFVSIFNLIGMAAAVFAFDADVVPVAYNMTGNPVMHADKWVLVIFGVLPLLFTIAFDIVMKNVRKNAEPDDSSFREKNQKVAPIAFVLLILIGWTAVITYDARYTKSYIKLSGWSLIVFGAASMYLSNFITRIKTDSRLVRFIPERLKDESLWNKTCRLLAYSCVTGGYVIMFTSAVGLLYDSEAIVLAGFAVGFLCLTIPTCMYVFGFQKKLRMRKKQLTKRSKTK